MVAAAHGSARSPRRAALARHLANIIEQAIANADRTLGELGALALDHALADDLDEAANVVATTGIILCRKGRR